MRQVAVVWAAALALLAAAAECEQIPLERVPDEAVRTRVGRLPDVISRSFPDAALKIAANVEKAVAYRGDGAVLLVVPDSRLDRKTLDDAGETATPAGWLILRGLAPVVEGGIPPLDRLATLEPDGSGQQVTVLFLGVRRDGAARLLEVYSRGAKPLLRLAITRKDGAAAPERPLDVKLLNADRAARQADCTILLPDGSEGTLRLGGTG